MDNEKAERIKTSAKEIADLLKLESYHTTVIIISDKVRITEDLYGFPVK